MIGKIIGAVAGSKLAKSARGMGGPTGALLGVGAATIAKRASLPVLVALTAGGYFAKKYLAKNNEVTTDPATPPKVQAPAL
ncbi:hypothetical protein QWY75_08075 [Pontixanthobacter aestiaquae]|uniref:Uncharacterized protein n=1 Tax=Pontixanthobacter aestiaquae TaxID=1509367 RepID=A0A844Z701_9SPHN|nr:hypothetical protein [Pontixanthobacter aestiaquae]MDN3646161.1 hypothetical protein [Pontixanthobacter aestiaquae]MXO82847.1 hypothetical protein [Pontixanthobacter aestiaquae]